MEYLINVGISFVPYIIGAVLFIVFVHFANTLFEWITVATNASEADQKRAKEVSASARKLAFNIVAPAILIFGLIISLVAPSNTYKHGSGHDRYQRDVQIQQINRTPVQAEIQDISRQPTLNTEDRKQRTEELHDFRNRVDNTK